MNLIKSVPFLSILILFSCGTEDEVENEKKLNEASAVGVTIDILNTLNDLEEMKKELEVLLNKEDSVLKDFKFNKIEPIYFDSSKDNQD